MIGHYIKIAWRNLTRQKALALINILGLSIGLACFSLFLLYAVNEFGFDRFHANASRIYRVYNWWNYSDRQGMEPSSTTPLGPAMKQDFADVEDFVRVTGGEKLIRIDNHVQRINVTFADPQLFSVFTFPLIEGNETTALQTEKSIVLTREKALMLFGKTDVVGKIIEIKMEDQFEPFEIEAVADDIPANSTIRFDILGNFGYILNTDYGKASMQNWNMTIGISVYVLLRENSSLMNEPGRLAGFYAKYFPDTAEEKTKTSAPSSGYGLQPLTDVHTNAKIDQWGAVNSRNIWILIGIAVGILLIACVNFVTLAISRSASRLTEVGIRKVIGSSKRQLIYQFLSESLLVSLLSAVPGLILAYTLLPFFNELSGRSLPLSFSLYPQIWVILAGVILLTGTLSGIYPAMVISGFKPSAVMKTNLRFSGSNLFTRSLVSFQFVLSIGLIVSIIVILRQLSFMQTKYLGFDKENVIMVGTQGIDVRKDYPVFKQSLEAESNILGVSASYMGLGNGEGQLGRRYQFENREEAVIEYPVDPEFLNVMKINLIAGRNFDPKIGSDTVHSVIVNESLVKNILGITPETALGKEFIDLGKAGNENEKSVKTIIGVSKNINFEDLTRTVRAQMFLCPADLRPNAIFVRINPGNPSKAVAAVTEAWNRISPGLPVKYHFLDQKFDDFYKKETRWSHIVSWACGICIFLACMGLMGLSSLAVINRSTEIGVRKVNGARVSEVMIMLSKEFVKGVVIAFVIASPIALYVMHKWLENFAYKTNLSWWIFVLAGVLALGIALLTVSWQSWKAATRNPVEALRYE